MPVYSTNGTKIKYNATVTLSDEYGATDYQISTSKDIELSATNAQTNQIVVTLKRAAETGSETAMFTGSTPITSAAIVRLI